ncbi:hypothetical protein E2C01_079515 [Portunus trituberculatus]|jgi:hypothetical protein
MVEE